MCLVRWSWRDSNPRPNVEPMSFLHAYLHLGFRVAAGMGRPTAALSSKSFGRLSRLSASYSRFNCTALSIRLGTWTIGRCLVPATVAGIKPIYCASIRQRERSCFRHLNFDVPDLRAWASWLCMLTHRLYTLSKPVNPVSLRSAVTKLAISGDMAKVFHAH